MTKAKFSRFKDAPWFPQQDIYVLVGGAGGIGSWTTLLLARAGFKPVVYDFDILEEHNMGGQLFPKKNIGQSKVEALEQVCKDFADEVITTVNDKVDDSTPSNYCAISAFDNMAARVAMFNSWKKEYATPTSANYDPSAIFIDGRLQAEHMQIFCVTVDNARIKEYESNLFDDADVEDAPCTMKQTSHAAAMIAAHIVAFFTNHITNKIEGVVSRTIPFKWEYFIPIDYLNVT